MSTATANPFEVINSELSSIKSLLLEIVNPTKKIQSNSRLNIDELRDYLPLTTRGERISKATIYRWVGDNTIPFHKPSGTKSLIFYSNEIDEWIISGKCKPLNEVCLTRKQRA